MAAPAAAGRAGRAERVGRRIGGGSVIDSGEAGRTPGRISDYFNVTSTAAMSQVKVSWLSGVHLALPAPSDTATAGISLTIDLAVDPATGPGDEESDVEGTSVTARFSIPPQTTLAPVRLERISGPGSLVVVLRGGRTPSISIVGLPADTVQVQYATTTTPGATLLTADDDCSKHPKAQQPKVTGRLTNGKRFETLLPPSRFAVCNGKDRPL